MAFQTPFDHLRARITGDLKAAIKNRDRGAAGALRAALGALDNATAVRGASGPMPAYAHDGPTEVPRRAVTPAEMESLLLAEAQDRAAAAVEYLRLQQHGRAAHLKAEARIIRGCLQHLVEMARESDR